MRGAPMPPYIYMLPVPVKRRRGTMLVDRTPVLVQA